MVQKVKTTKYLFATEYDENDKLISPEWTFLNTERRYELNYALEVSYSPHELVGLLWDSFGTFYSYVDTLKEVNFELGKYNFTSEINREGLACLWCLYDKVLLAEVDANEEVIDIGALPLGTLESQLNAGIIDLQMYELFGYNQILNQVHQDDPVKYERYLAIAKSALERAYPSNPTAATMIVKVLQL